MASFPGYSINYHFTNGTSTSATSGQPCERCGEIAEPYYVSNEMGLTMFRGCAKCLTQDDATPAKTGTSSTYHLKRLLFQACYYLSNPATAGEIGEYLDSARSQMQLPEDHRWEQIE